ncbi:MAG: HD domain-containing protein [Candidatus Zambryskibacteria bacterium]|nr:HD domain-containing protein [Candidatus Zambryskibacteria bacterium]
MKKIKKHKDDSIKKVANLLFEYGILAKTPRSGFYFLGTGDQTVAEHINRVSFIGYALATMDGTVDILKVLKMCLLHDISETRISDLNYVHQKYVEKKEHQAVKDISDSVHFGKDIFDTIEEYEERKSKESILVKDADNLEWILALKEEVDTGNTRALKWIASAMKRLKTPNAKKIVKEIMKTDSNDWWFDKESQKSNWWINRDKK